MSGLTLAEARRLAHDIRPLLAHHASISHIKAGNTRLVIALWERAGLPPTTAQRRGMATRRMLWHLIAQHHRRARQHRVCEVCEEVAGHDDWQTLWLLTRWSDDGSFAQRLSLPQIAALGRLAADEDAPVVPRERALYLQAVAELRRMPDLTELRAACPTGQSRGKRVGLHPNSYVNKKTRALAGLVLHLTSGCENTGRLLVRFEAHVRGGQRHGPSDTRDPKSAADHVVQGRVALAPDVGRSGRRTDGTAEATGREHEPASAVKSAQLAHSAPRLPLSGLPWRVAAVAVLLLTFALGVNLPRRISVALSFAAMHGWLLARQWVSGEPYIIAAVSLQTGQWRALWPTSAYVAAELQGTEPANDFYWVTSPAYTPATQRLALIASDGHGRHSIWALRLQHGDGGWPVVAPEGPVRLVDDCQCETLAWSPSGTALIYATPAGLMALTGTGQQQVTSGMGDAWPACSPDGHWLAFQHEAAGIVALPARDCLPAPGAQPSGIAGYAPAWHPAWSSDGHLLTFVSNAGGPRHVYVMATADLTDRSVAGRQAQIEPLAAAGCTDPVLAPSTRPPGWMVIAACDQATPVSRVGQLVAAPAGVPDFWQAVAADNLMHRDNLDWVPAL